MKNGLLAIVICLFSPLIVWAQLPNGDLGPPNLVEGERLFRVHCARCHGIDGAGGEGSNLARPVLKYVTDHEAMMGVISNGIPGTGMPGIWTLDPKQTNWVAAYALTLGDLEEEAMPGDPERGAKIYQTSGGCPACHIIAGHGNGIGPELTFVGDQRGLQYLHNSLVRPAEAQSQTSGYQDYLTVRVQSSTGRVEGLRINEDAFSIQVRDISGKVHSFRKDEVRDIEKIFAHSLMPEYGTALSAQDIDDLVSYMMSLRSEQ